MQRSEDSALACVFVEQRPELHALAARMLGSSSDAQDVVQETWLRLARIPNPETIENPAGWLRTVLTRICLDTLRTRRVRPETVALESLDHSSHDGDDGAAPDPADQAVLADAVGRALLVVLDTLDPAERIAFVLHDMFDVSHAEIADLVGRSAGAAKKLASRARQKVRGTTPMSGHELAVHRGIVAAFLDAARAGDLDAVLAVLAPDVVRHVDPVVLAPGVSPVLSGAQSVAEGTVLLAQRAAHADLALVNGAPGLVVAPQGRLTIVLAFTIDQGLIQAYDVIADPKRLAALDLAVLP